MTELLVEIYCEEIPARMQLQATADFKELWLKVLKEKNAAFERVETYAASRRLTACIKGLAAYTAGTQEIRRGPRTTAPEAALAGFLKSSGKTKDQLIQKNGYWYAELTQDGKAIQDLLPEILDEVTDKMPWPKTMRWYNHQTKSISKPWIRPIRSLLCVYDQKPVVFNMPGFRVSTSNTTLGHRFLAPNILSVTSFADYKQKLKESFVILDHHERQMMIKKLLEEQAMAKGLYVQEDQSLLEEVTGLVDYPFAHLGEIEKTFMHLPNVVLSTSMRVHQKYFTILDKNGQIAPFFGVITNVPAKPDHHLMLDGLERVLRARLADADFFYKEDLKQWPLGGDEALSISSEKLKWFRKRLEETIFHEKLGTQFFRVCRLQSLMKGPSRFYVFQNDISLEGREAAALCKLDLLTQMVGEFPELQGVIGEIYALKRGFKPEIARCIRDHYKPQGPSDPCPTAPLSAQLAFWDKLDTLVGFIGVGLQPTGSKDPFGLRRAALGIIRLVIENNWQIDLSWPIEESYEAYKRIQKVYSMQNLYLPEDTVSKVLHFIYERFKGYLKEQGYFHDTIEASFFGNDLWLIAERVKALQAFIETADGHALKAAYKRASGILVNASQKKPVNSHLLEQDAEKALFNSLSDAQKSCHPYLAKHKYQEVMGFLASLRPRIDDFFEQVTINCEDSVLRENRYALLQEFTGFVHKIVDFSKLQGQQSPWISQIIFQQID